MSGTNIGITAAGVITAVAAAGVVAVHSEISKKSLMERMAKTESAQVACNVVNTETLNEVKNMRTRNMAVSTQIQNHTRDLSIMDERLRDIESSLEMLVDIMMERISDDKKQQYEKDIKKKEEEMKKFMRSQERQKQQITNRQSVSNRDNTHQDVHEDDFTDTDIT